MPQKTSGLLAIPHASGDSVFRGGPVHIGTHRILLSALLALGVPWFSGIAVADSIVVFNEVMYHPATNEAGLEWVELHNQNAVDVDLGGWRIAGGIDFVFPDTVVIRGGGFLVVAASPAALTAATGVTNLVGPFLGRLSNNGNELRLRDRNNRLMDSLDFGVEGDWPEGADGSGLSLAKRQLNLASGPAQNWTVSVQVGGSPGTMNFAPVILTGAKTNLVGVASSWRFQDSGADLGTGWRAPGFDDSGWPSGPALFYYEDAALPGPKNTPLTPGRSTYYFRTTFNVTGDPLMKLLSVRPFVDDGVVLYLNGVEIQRFNMPTGAVSFSTPAFASVPNASLGASVSLPVSNLLSGINVLAAELHQSSATTNAGLRILPTSAYTTAWDGSEGDFSTPGTPALAPPNAARASLGVEVFTSSNTNLAANLNDGRYGNASAWSPAASDLNPVAILRFNQVIPVSSIAWSRDNGDTNDAACGGTCTDRTLGNYTLQYTLHADPASISANSSNPTNGWTTLSTVQYLSVQPGFTPHLRHRFDLAATNSLPIFATGIRFRPATATTIDEIEINPPAVPNFDAVFGLELTATDILPPPPKLAFNEISSATNAGFWLELGNWGETTVDLAGVEIVRGAAHFSLPAQLLAPHGIVAFTQAQLGFGAAEGDTLFLHTPGRFALLDAVTVKAGSRGRFPDGVGDWMYPQLPTPGSSNLVALRSDIVINEIMYHARPLDPVPAVTSNTLVAPVSGTWRFNDSGADLGSAWRGAGYDDSGWPMGAGPLAFNAGPLPVAPGTMLAGGRPTYYFRRSFNFSGATSNVTLDVRAIVDDGAVFYLNGTEVFRQNMPTGPIGYATSALGPVGDAGYANPIVVPAASLIQGANMLAVEVHQVTSAAGSSGIVLSGGGLQLVEEGPFGGSPPMNLARQAGSMPFVIDSLVGYPIHDYLHLDDGQYGNSFSWIGNSGSPGYAGIRFSATNSISSVAFGRDNLGTFSDRTLGTYTLQYTRVAAPGAGTTVTGNADTGWATIGTLNYQNAGTGLFTAPSRRHRFTFTPVAASGMRLVVPSTGIGTGTCIDELEVNPPDTSGDIVFGAELSFTTTLSPALPYRASDEEWVELYNRGASAVDLTGWRLDAGIDFRFTNGPILLPGAYVVAARNADALRLNWPELSGRIVGDFSGRLASGRRYLLRDAAGNPVDETRIVGGGWSDGGGASLELRDIDGDHMNPASWADSDEIAKAAWQSVTYRMVAGQNFGPTLWNEFRIGLLDAGVVLLDDVSVVRDPEGAHEQLIQNGSFETTTGNTHWRFLGHHRGEFATDPDNAANHVLRLSTEDRAVMNHNHVETTFLNNAPLVNGQLYEVSYRARWVAGSPQLNTRGYFSRLARTTLLPIPARLGTPGAANSRLIPNAGPTFTGLQHAPVVPAASQAVNISVRAADPDGVASATLSYRVNPATAFTTVPMAMNTNGAWTALIAGQGAGAIVHFYVTAVDFLGATATAPARGPNSRALYQVADGQGTGLPVHELRLIMLNADRDFMLNATNVMSNARNAATLIYDRTEVFYDAGAKLQGTAASRIRDGDNYVSYDIDFPPDQLFRGVQNNIGIDRSGRGPVVRGQDEIALLQMFHRAGIPCQYSDLCYFIAPRTLHSGTAILQLAAYGSGFVSEQYGEDGAVFNLDLTYEPQSTADGGMESVKLPVPLQSHIGTDFTDLGDKEQYRPPFDIRSANRRDDYAGIIRLNQTMALPQAQFDAQIGKVLDVDEVLRMVALEILCGVGDTYISAGANLQHNLRLYSSADGDPVQFLPWDMDFAYSAGATSSIFPYSGFNLGKLMLNPGTLRRYLHHVSDLCQTAFNTDYMTPWLAHYGSVVGQNISANGSNYIASRRAYALSQIPAGVPFAITSNGGVSFSVDTNFVVLTGTAWIDLEAIEVNLVPRSIAWASITNWSIVVPLLPGPNVLAVQGVDYAGNRRPDLLRTIRITNTTASGLMPVVINEWMANNAAPGGLADTADGLFQDWFELYNPNATAVNLGGFFLTDNLANPTKFPIPTDTIIAGHGYLLVWADEDGLQNSATNADLHANFKLSNGGEELGLFAPDGVTAQHAFGFGGQFLNVSQGLFPDGAIGSIHFMTNWTPRMPNQLGLPAPPSINTLTVASGQLQFWINAIPGRSYQVESKASLDDAMTWLPAGPARAASSASLVLDVHIGAEPQRFFRIRLL